MKRRIDKLADMIQVLKTVSCTVSSPLQEKFKAMEPLYGQFSVHTLCDALEISHGTFCNHIFRNKKGDALAAKRRAELKTQIQSIYDDSRQIYRAGKITAILQNQGVKTSQKYVSRLMKEWESATSLLRQRRNIKDGRRDKTKISCSSSSKPNGRIKSGSATSLFLNSMTSIIISASS